MTNGVIINTGRIYLDKKGGSQINLPQDITKVLNFKNKEKIIVEASNKHLVCIELKPAEEVKS